MASLLRWYLSRNVKQMEEYTSWNSKYKEPGGAGMVGNLNKHAYVAREKKESEKG